MPEFSPPSPPADTHLHWIDSTTLSSLVEQDTTAHRLASSHAAWVERFGEDLLVSHQNDPALTFALRELDAWRVAHAIPVRRVFTRFVPTQNEGRIAPVLVEGDATLPPTGVATERGLRFTTGFAAGYSAGIFLDQRANRRFLCADPPVRLLNLFAYTCAFSVAAAAVGAATVSIDLSKKWLDRGRENFALNAIDTAGHRFIADDVLDVLPRLVRRGEKFDAIVIDPPTFARGKRPRPFRVEDDMPALVAAAFALSAPGARILLSTNCMSLDVPALEAIATAEARAAGRKVRFHREPPLPDLPAEYAPSTLWLLT